jgi:hypothetical protein
MAKNQEVQTAERTIAGVMFEITMPYEEGHTLTAAEARALNQTRAEGIGNNMRKLVNEAKDENGEVPEEALSELAQKVAEYSDSYEFSMPGTGGTRVADPFLRECISIAKSILSRAIKEKGMTVKAYLEGEGNQEKYDANLALLAEREDVTQAAKERLAARANLQETGSDISL